ncbi:UNVERIFIED_CONTAM: hypothetical protein GTU68_046254 [Idotea baltica]|nr:hypothetical protein [Idotea baltica]
MAKKKPATKKQLPKVNLEEALVELEEITAELESGTENLDHSIDQFERGMQLLKSCNQQLDAAARRIEVVTNVDEDGQVHTEPFGDLATFDQPSEGDPPLMDLMTE